MKTNVLVVWLFSSALTAATASAHPAPFNEIGVTMGHWHIVSKDVEANTTLFLALGGKLFMPGGNPLIMFPGSISTWPRHREGRRRYRGFGDQPCRLHRQQRPGEDGPD
jgi:hypothetical protein